ncbi:M61 family metallopeptidase [Jiulongibacter sediminis]|uniref:M61 family metallopeptidase n=1 Tax=Jiulongibacter sediminis TaxID=1605367 RepID=UPI0026F2F3F7|nr:M61 family peptidase [Jiulongibacter sediminis]
MNYKISVENIHSKYLNIKALFSKIDSQKLLVKLPAWRPGRYEIQNFAQYIRDVKAFGPDQKELKIKKITKDSWEIETKNQSDITITYQFNADIGNAGGSYVDDAFLYINPINCLMYLEDRQNEKCGLEVDFKSNQQVACGMSHTKEASKVNFVADSYHDLVDSPLMISDSIRHKTYEVEGSTFHIWIKGKTEIDWPRVLRDFEKFTRKQIEVFGEFPEKEYRFMLWMMPEANYHGVEHRNSTMMTLGPVSQEFDEFYIDFLGLSSHELFHTWNVKRIRPKELLPYDYSQENYFETCFVAEGITTFYGDWMLYRSGVFSLEQFQKELETTLRRHFDTSDQATESLLQSSFDLWLDGYKKGVPERKVSVYHKGAVAAIILHDIIQKATDQKKGLDDVMKILWLQYGKPFEGYTLDDYITVCEKVTGHTLVEYFLSVIAGNNSVWEQTQEAIRSLGFEMTRSLEGYTQLNLKEASNS